MPGDLPQDVHAHASISHPGEPGGPQVVAAQVAGSQFGLIASYSELRSALTREVAMNDPSDPYSRDNLSWNWGSGYPGWRPFSGRAGRGPRVPPPPWARKPPKPSKAEREQEERADARAERLHLVGLTKAAVIIMGVVLGAVVFMVVLVLVNYR